MTHQRQLQSYTRQIERLSQRIKQLERRSNQIATWRLLVLLMGGVPTIFLLFSSYPALFGLVASLTVIAFIGLIAIHRRVDHSIVKHRLWRTIKLEQRARMSLDWKHIPSTGYSGLQTPLENDLDLRDIHRLLNTAVSYAGSARLHRWLIAPPADLDTIELRQKRVQELIPRHGLRDKLIFAARLAPAQARHRLDTAWLQSWLHTELPLVVVNRTIGILTVLAVISLTTIVLSQLGIVSPAIAGIAWGLYALFYVSRSGLVMHISDDGQQLYDVLQRLRSILSHLERYDYQSLPETRQLLRPIIDNQPSALLRQLMVTLAASNLRGNPPLWLFLNALIPWDLIFLRRLYMQKETLLHALPEWLDIWYELEALSSLANFAYLNAGTVMPELHADTQRPVLDAQQLGHPLIPAERRVVNDFTFHQVGELIILTGSNMSGKSSFLRTLGVNLALAYAGGAVLASRFDVRLMRLFSCIRVTDSLDDGISYFYAEVKRLKALLDALQTPHESPLFFLIDEIFKGTNNRERLIGSRAYSQALIGANGVGFIATHDLELTALADGQPLVRNMHFREHLQDGRMVFDYLLREGASPTTNALTIMAYEGLPVPMEADSRPDTTPPSQT